MTPAAGALVLVSGEAGIGKTRLLEEFGAREPDALLARGGCVDGVPYAPWSDALGWLLDTLGNAVIGELPGYVGPQLARLIPSLTSLDLTGATVEDGQQLLFDAVADLLRHVARGRRLVFIVDDMHWIDPASRDLLRYVASNLRRIPMLLVAAFRPEDSITEQDLVAQLGRLAADRVVLDRLPRGADDRDRVDPAGRRSGARRPRPDRATTRTGTRCSSRNWWRPLDPKASPRRSAT